MNSDMTQELLKTGAMGKPQGERHALKKEKHDDMPPVHHLAIIPDGNRRWAKERGLPSEEGHRTGLLDVSPAILRAAFARKIHTVTLWLFSTENWSRSKSEVDYLMEINQTFLQKMRSVAREQKIRLAHLGRKDRIPGSLLKEILEAEEETKSHKNHHFNFAIDYGGRDELIRAMQKLYREITDPEKINEEMVCRLLDTAGQEHTCPDIIIRTSGEHRVSGFLPWQSDYSELFFLEKHFPDFTELDLDLALSVYQKRERRFGA